MPLDKNPEPTENNGAASRPRRRATRKVAAPQAVDKLDVLAELGADAHGAAHDETNAGRERTEAQLNAALDLASAERGEAPKKPARKRATRPAAPVAADVPGAAADEVSGAADADPEAPARRTTRTRAKKAAVETSDVVGSDVTADATTSDASGSATKKTAATRSTARSASAKTGTARKASTRKAPAADAPSDGATSAMPTTPEVSATPEVPTAGATASAAPAKGRSRRASAAAATTGTPSDAAPETTPSTDSRTADDQPTAAPKARRSRRAAGAAAAGDDASTATATEPEADTSGDAATAPAKRTSRRASTRKTAEAPVPAASDEAVPDQTAPDQTAPDEVAGAPAPQKAPAKRASRRATSRSGAPQADVAAETAAPAEADGTTAETSSTRPATRSRRATRQSTTTAPAAADATVPQVEPASTSDAATTPAAATANDTQAPQRPRLAATAVLFQAPDLGAARPKRRRVSAPAGSPDQVRAGVHVDAPGSATTDETALTPEELLAEEEALAAAALAEAEAVDAESANDEQPEDEQSDEAPRRRRRRGGRGRRHRGGNGSDENGADDDDLDGTEDSEAEASESAADEAETEDSDEAPARQRGGRNRGGRSRGSRSGRSGNEDQDDAEPAPAGDAAGTDDARTDDDSTDDPDEQDDDATGSSRRRRRRRRGGRGSEGRGDSRAESREPEGRTRSSRNDEVTALKGSTRLEAKRQRRRDGRDAGRRRQVITESEFLARRESVERSMIVRERHGRTQIAVLEDNVLVEHYVSQQEQASMAGNVYLGRVQNVLPSMEAAFIDVGKGRNAVLYAGEVNWDASGLANGQPRRIELALKSGDSVLVQVTKDPIGQKGARLTSQITLAGRYLVYVPGGGMTGISRKLPETERARLKRILREAVPEAAGVIVRTAAEGASEDELKADIARLQGQWAAIEKKAKSASAPALLQGEPDLSIRVVRDIFNDDFTSLVVSGESAWTEISDYVGALAPDLASKVTRWTSERDVFAEHRIDEQLAKGLDRKVYLPSGGSLVIDRTEAMTVVDVNTGKFTGAGGTLEETVTRNNLEAAEEIVRQLRLRDIGGIIVVDFIDMVLESNRDLVLRRLVECLGRDRTKHQVAEVTSLGLVQMTRKRVGQGLVEAFSETCEHCHGRGFIVHDEPIERGGSSNHQHSGAGTSKGSSKSSGKSSKASGRSGGDAAGNDTAVDDAVTTEAAPKRSRRRKASAPAAEPVVVPVLPEERSEAREAVKATLAQIAAAAQHAHDAGHEVAQEEKA